MQSQTQYNFLILIITQTMAQRFTIRELNLPLCCSVFRERRGENALRINNMTIRTWYPHAFVIKAKFGLVATIFMQPCRAHEKRTARCVFTNFSYFEVFLGVCIFRKKLTLSSPFETFCRINNWDHNFTINFHFVFDRLNERHVRFTIAINTYQKSVTDYRTWSGSLILLDVFINFFIHL